MRINRHAFAVFALATAIANGQSAATTTATATPERIRAESVKANAFFERAFNETLARSPMFMTQLGMKQDYDKWDDFSEAAALDTLLLNVRQLAELKRTIDLAALDAQTRVSHRMFADEAERAIEGWKWRYHNYPFNQMSGRHLEVPAFVINFHRVDTVDDARAYIARLQGIGPMFDQLIEGVRIRESRNIIPPRFVFPLLIDSAREIIRGEPFDSSGKKSALLEDFESKVGALKDTDAPTRQQLLAGARAALTGVVQPAYGKLIALFEAQQKTATDDDGAWKFPEGPDYYNFALLKILELRERAKKELGAKFDLREYHDLVLKDGAVPLDILDENVRAWIATR